MDATQTKYPATRTVHCPNGPTHACDLHASQITGLMRFLGAHVVHTAAPDDAVCENCENEAKAKTPNDAIEGPEQAQLANGPARMEGSTP